MANNQMTTQKAKFSMAINTPTYRNLIAQTLGDKKKAERYTAAIMSAVATNPQLQMCEAATILSGSLLAESLNLAHSPQLGQYYLVPFKVKEKKVKDAQGNWKTIAEHYDAAFILGYKGYIQLATRSGFYRHINAIEIKEGELSYYNPFDDEIELTPIQDFDEREAAPTIGYYAMFEYLNGFKKVLYWSKQKMIKHADRYSPAFSAAAYSKIQKGEISESDMWKYSSFWYKDFDEMARKTMLRQLIGKWGVMSPEMQQAYEADNKIIMQNGDAIIPDETADDIPEPVVAQEPESGTVNIDDL